MKMLATTGPGRLEVERVATSFHHKSRQYLWTEQLGRWTVPLNGVQLLMDLRLCWVLYIGPHVAHSLHVIYPTSLALSACGVITPLPQGGVFPRAMSVRRMLMRIAIVLSGCISGPRINSDWEEGLM